MLRRARKRLPSKWLRKNGGRISEIKTKCRGGGGGAEKKVGVRSGSVRLSGRPRTIQGIAAAQCDVFAVMSPGTHPHC